MSKISWTDVTWNPITGCTPISEGCANCYAQRWAKRLQQIGLGKYLNGFKPTFHPEELKKPLKWRKPRIVFVCSMGDIFHQYIDSDFVHRIFGVIRECPQHTFQVLTKRAERSAYYAEGYSYLKNVWFGVTVESDKYLRRINYLPAYNNKCKTFISFEPILGPIGDINLEGINWVIVGGETGPGARPMKIEWARQIRDMCIDQGVPFFFKSHGGTRKRPGHNVLDGKIWNQMPIT